MRMGKTTVVALALLSSAPALTAAHAASIPTASFSVPDHTSKKDWMTTLVQDNEGVPNPDRERHCTLISRSVADVHGHFIGYQTFPVCR